MHKILLASAAAVLMTGSLANAQFLLGQDENGHKQVTNLWAEQAQPAESRAVYSYGPRRSTARIAQDGMSVTTSGAGVSPGFLLGSDANGHKEVDNQYAR